MDEGKPANSNEEVEQETKPQQAGNSQQTSNEDEGNVKVMSALAYLGFLFFLPLITNSESEFGRYHANQGLLLFIASIAVSVVGSVIPFLGWFIILPFGGIFVFVLFIMGIMHAINGEKKPLPLIGEIQLIK